jgi:hypothetical protein
MLMEMVKPKPDISFATNTGHFHLLPTDVFREFAGTTDDTDKIHWSVVPVGSTLQSVLSSWRGLWRLWLTWLRR